MSHHAHCDEHDEEIDVDGQVGEPAVFCQGADLTESEPANCPYETADSVAESELGDLR